MILTLYLPQRGREGKEWGRQAQSKCAKHIIIIIYSTIINNYNGFFFTFSSSCVWAAFSCCSAWAKRDIILPRSSWSVGTINNDHCECPFFDQESNPFAPEPPKTTTSYVSHVWSSVLMVKDKFVSTLCRRKRSFKLHQNEHDSVKGTDKMAKRKPCKVDLKI